MLESDSYHKNIGKNTSQLVNDPAALALPHIVGQSLIELPILNNTLHKKR